jgi:hypothetical protein
VILSLGSSTFGLFDKFGNVPGRGLISNHLS